LAGAASAGSGTFTLEGEQRQLTRLTVTDSGDQYNPGVHQFNVYLVSDGIEVGKYGPSGSGDAVVLKLHGADTDLAAGSYSFERAIKPDAGTLTGITVYTGYDFGGGAGGQYAIIGGKVDVERSGGGFAFDLDLKLSPTRSGGTLRMQGQYSGEVDSRHEL
jgi:hypothetical protein